MISGKIYNHIKLTELRILKNLIKNINHQDLKQYYKNYVSSIFIILEECSFGPKLWFTIQNRYRYEHFFTFYLIPSLLCVPHWGMWHPVTNWSWQEMCWVGGWGIVTTEVGVGDGRLLLRNGRRRDTTRISVRGQSGSYDSHNGPSNSKESWPEHLTSNTTSVCSKIRCYCFSKLLILKFIARAESIINKT